MSLVEGKYGIYLHRSVRRAGRVTSQYLGSGLVALSQALEMEERRAAAEARREQHRAIAQECGAIDEALAGLAREAMSGARAALEAAGCYQHARGQWRKRHVRAHD
jgi:hypothetical protein